MPSFYPRPIPGQLPLTPPDSGSRFGYSSMHYPSDPYTTHQSLSESRRDNSYGGYAQYLSQQMPPAPSAYQYPQSNYQPPPSLPPIQNYYEPIGAPILPPLRIQDTVSFTDDYKRRLQQDQQNNAARDERRPPPKEEKPTGGVSAKLDYDMDRMTDFVTQATQSIFRHDMQNQATFRKWVHQVLAATRLPSATILLSLHFLNDRVAKYPDSIQSGENQIYRLLAVSLILGSKFLDDNTFINRSWSDVTAIKVSELNLLELKWLQLIHYHLHIDPNQPNGLQAWLDSWKNFDAKYTAKQQQRVRLSPVNTNNNAYRSTRISDRFSPYPSPYSAPATRGYNTPTTISSRFGTSHYQQADPWSSVSQQSFDDFYKPTERYPTLNELNDVNRRVTEERARQSAYAQQQTAYSSYYNSPNYGSTWDQQPWNNGTHQYDCTCSACTYQYRPYPMPSGYAAQPVMG